MANNAWKLPATPSCSTRRFGLPFRSLLKGCKSARRWCPLEADCRDVLGNTGFLCLEEYPPIRMH